MAARDGARPRSTGATYGGVGGGGVRGWAGAAYEGRARAAYGGRREDWNDDGGIGRVAHDGLGQGRRTRGWSRRDTAGWALDGVRPGWCGTAYGRGGAGSRTAEGAGSRTPEVERADVRRGGVGWRVPLLVG
ncbi:hypothetical protein [Kribbella swartbergensis]